MTVDAATDRQRHRAFRFLILPALLYVSVATSATEPLQLGISFDFNEESEVFFQDLTRAEIDDVSQATESVLAEQLSIATNLWTPRVREANLVTLRATLEEARDEGYLSVELTSNTAPVFLKVSSFRLPLLSDTDLLKRELKKAVIDFFDEYGKNLEAKLADQYEELKFINGPPVEVAIAMNDLPQQDVLLYDDRFIHISFDHKERPDVVQRGPAGRYPTTTAFATVGATRSGTVYRATSIGTMRADTGSTFCIARAGREETTGAGIAFKCPTSGMCTSVDAHPSQWFSPGCESVADTSDFWSRLPNWFISSAHAVPSPGTAWHVPSLDTLLRNRNRGTIIGTGYTDFRIRSDEPLAVDADSYALHIMVNGVPLRFDGIPPEDTPRGLQPTRPVVISFAIESLNFSGAQNGCDVISARLEFFRDRQPTGNSVELQRPYVSLRHPVDYSIKVANNGTFQWTGRYVPPVQEAESGIFVLGRNVPGPAERGGGTAAERQSRTDILQRIAKARQEFDSLGWSVPASTLPKTAVMHPDASIPLVGVIRPPRIRNSRSDAYGYGLLVGVELPTGQIRFTFFNDERSALIGQLRQLGRDEPDPQKLQILKGLLPANEKPFDYPYTYTEKKRLELEPWICGEDRYLSAAQ